MNRHAITDPARETAQSSPFPSPDELQQKMRRLAAVEAPELPVLSIYLDMRPQATGQSPGRRAGLTVLRDRLRDIEQTYWPRGDDYDSFKADEERITRYLDDEFDTAAHGLALFTCSGIGLWESVPSGVPFRDAVSAGPRADLFQLARLADTHEAAVVALVDSNTARLFVTRTGRLEEVAGPDEDSASFRKRSLGGWSEQRFQRHIDKHIADFARESAAAIEELVQEEDARWLVLAGDEVALKPLDEALSEAVKAKVEDVLRVGIRAARNELDDEVRAAIERAEEESGMSVADRLIGAVRGDGLGVAGVKQTRRMLEAGAVETLVLLGLPGRAADTTSIHDARDLHERGEVAEEGDGGTIDLELRNELVRLAVATSAEVEVVAQHAALEKAGGVGALLRYRPG